MTTSSETASDARLFSTHPCSADLGDLLLCLCVFTGPPGKRGRMGRRGEPGKWRPPPALFVYFSSLFLEDTLFLHVSPLSLTCSHIPSLFLDDWRSSRAGKSSDPWVRPADDGLQLALLPVPRYLRRHSANLGHVVALTLPRCQSFSLSGSSCSSTGLMRLSLANIPTHHYCVAFSFPRRPQNTHRGTKTVQGHNSCYTKGRHDRWQSGCSTSLNHPHFKWFLLSVDSTKLWRDSVRRFYLNLQDWSCSAGYVSDGKTSTLVVIHCCGYLVDETCSWEDDD